MIINQDLQERYDSNRINQPTIEVNFIKEIEVETITKQVVNTTYTDIGSTTVDWNWTFRLSDGRYIIIDPSASSAGQYFVCIRDSTLDESSQVVKITGQQLYADGVSRGYNTKNSAGTVYRIYVFQDGDKFYITCNAAVDGITRMVSLNPEDDYSVIHIHVMTIVTNGYDLMGYPFKINYLMKLNGKYFGFYGGGNTYYFFESTDLVFFTIINHLLLDDYNGSNDFKVINDDKRIYIMARTISGVNNHFYDCGNNQIIIDAVETDLYYNISGNDYFFDSVTQYFYYQPLPNRANNPLIRKKYGQAEEVIGNYFREVLKLIGHKEGSELKIDAVLANGVYTGQPPYLLQKFGSITSTVISKVPIDVAHNIQSLDIAIGDNGINPTFSANFFIENDNDHALIQTINVPKISDVLIRPERKVEIYANFPLTNGIQRIKLFEGYNDKKSKSLHTAKLKGYGNMSMLNYEVKSFSLPKDTLINTLKNILLRHPLITIADFDLDFGNTGIEYPASTFNTGELMAHIKKVMELFPDYIFYYGLDGKWKLRSVLSNQTTFFNFKDDKITELDWKEEGLGVNVVTVTSNNLFGNKITSIATDSADYKRYGKVGISKTTSLYKTQSDCDKFANRLLTFYRNNGIHTVTFSIPDIYIFDLYELITIINYNENWTTNKKWMITDYKISFTNKQFKTTFTAESWAGI